MLSHEATFTADMYAKARIAQHSTAPMAGNFARQLGAQTLVLTHFSGRFTEFRGKVKPYVFVRLTSLGLVCTHAVKWHRPLSGDAGAPLMIAACNICWQRTDLKS